MFIKRIYRKLNTYMPVSIQNTMNSLYRKYFYKYRERKIRPGNLNSEKVFYVIRNVGPAQGFLNNYIEVLRKIEYAKKKGYIPIVDFKNYFRCVMQSEMEAWKENAWEYYFEQPQKKYSLENIYASQNVILSIGEDVYGYKGWPKYDSDNSVLQNYYLIHREYAYFNSNILEEVKKYSQTVFARYNKVLGVSYRMELEWGMKNNNPVYVDNILHHPKKTMEELIKEIDKCLEKYHYDVFFLAGDDRETTTNMQKKYGDRCIIYNRHLPHYFEKGKATKTKEERSIEYSNMRNGCQVQQKEYLVETILLSKCNGLIGIDTSANTCACIFNNNSYEIKQ